MVVWKSELEILRNLLEKKRKRDWFIAITTLMWLYSGCCYKTLFWTYYINQSVFRVHILAKNIAAGFIFYTCCYIVFCMLILFRITLFFFILFYFVLILICFNTIFNCLKDKNLYNSTVLPFSLILLKNLVSRVYSAKMQILSYFPKISLRVKYLFSALLNSFSFYAFKMKPEKSRAVTVFFCICIDSLLLHT